MALPHRRAARSGTMPAARWALGLALAVQPAHGETVALAGYGTHVELLATQSMRVLPVLGEESLLCFVPNDDNVSSAGHPHHNLICRGYPRELPVVAGSEGGGG